MIETLSFAQRIHLLALLKPLAAMGWPTALWLMGTGLLVSLGARRHPRSSAWFGLLGTLAAGSLWSLQPGGAESGLFLAALLGTGLLLWILLAPLWLRLTPALSALCWGLATLSLLNDIAFSLSWGLVKLITTPAQLNNPWMASALGMWHLLALMGLLAVLLAKGWLTQVWVRHLALVYLGAMLFICGLGSLDGRFPPYPYQDPTLYLTAIAAGAFISQLYASQWPEQPDILERYKPYTGIALTHVFLILFTIATLYPVLWVFKMAVTPQQGFILGINPVPQPLVHYVNAWRKGDHKGAMCYRRAMLQNFREVMGQGSACYDRVCRSWRQHKNQHLLQQADAICRPFAALWSKAPKLTPPTKVSADPKQLASWRQEAIESWRNKKIKHWKAQSLARLKVTDKASPLGKLLQEIAYEQAERKEQQSLFWQQVLNSILVALVTTFLGLFLACTAAYAFSRFRFPGRRMGLMSFLVSQMFPGTLMMIPLYILISRLGLLNSLLGLTLVYSTTSIPFCVWMLKGYFDTIPKELEEAALIDGASRTLIFWKIMLPLARPAIAVTALFSFMTAWNEFILAVTFMNDKTSFTLPVMLRQYVGSHNTEWGHFAAGAVLVSLPIVLLFFFLQKNLVSGLTAGSVKG